MDNKMNHNIITFYITSDNLHSRLDKFLANEMKSSLSRNDVQYAIENSFVKVNEQISTKNSLQLKENDIIEIDISYTIKDEKVQNSIVKSGYKAIEILFENDNLFIVNKPRNLSTHPGAGNSSNTLMNVLLDMGKSLATYRGEDRMGIVHRLDKDTSGLLIIAKHNRAHQLLCDMVANKDVSRKYLCICYGTPMPYSGTVDTYITRDKRNIEKMKIITNHNEDNDDSIDTKRAITHYKVLKILDNGKFSLVECNLETGRTHQIRAHMQYIKHPIVGDKLYTDNRFAHIKSLFKIPNFQLLHSYKIEFEDPISGEYINIERHCPEIDEIVNDYE
jgi:23S rRNA pseudouridine1911/1915/1917 synthase